MMSIIFNEVYSIGNNTRGRIFLLFFRLATMQTNNILTKLLIYFFKFFYKFIIQWYLSIDIPLKTKIGHNFQLFHGLGVVIHQDVILGNNIILRQNTTIGIKRDKGGAPVFKNNIDVGANVVILGHITIGSNSVIAAGSVVITDVPENSLVAGNPAKVKKIYEK
jgi:putative colanic acid biosynthesis acetyltransferase WcaB